MKHVQHICQQQKALTDQLGAFSPRIVIPARQHQTLTCSRWRTGRKLNIKVSVINATN